MSSFFLKFFLDLVFGTVYKGKQDNKLTLSGEIFMSKITHTLQVLFVTERTDLGITDREHIKISLVSLNGEPIAPSDDNIRTATTLIQSLLNAGGKRQ